MSVAEPIVQTPPQLRPGAARKPLGKRVMMLVRRGHLYLVVDRVVADHVDHLVLAERPPQVVQVPQEQARRSAFLLVAPGLDQPPGPPVQAPGQHPLLVVPRRVHRRLLAPPGPHAPDLRVRVDLASTSSMNTAVSSAGRARRSSRRAASRAARSGSVLRTTGRGRRHTSPAVAKVRRTVSRPTRTWQSSRRTMATVSQLHRLRANPNSRGRRVSTQATIVPAQWANRPGRGGRTVTTPMPPVQYRPTHRATVADEHPRAAVRVAYVTPADRSRRTSARCRVAWSSAVRTMSRRPACWSGRRVIEHMGACVLRSARVVTATVGPGLPSSHHPLSSGRAAI